MCRCEWDVLKASLRAGVVDAVSQYAKKSEGRQEKRKQKVRGRIT